MKTKLFVLMIVVLLSTQFLVANNGCCVVEGEILAVTPTITIPQAYDTSGSVTIMIITTNYLSKYLDVPTYTVNGRTYFKLTYTELASKGISPNNIFMMTVNFANSQVVSIGPYIPNNHYWIDLVLSVQRLTLGVEINRP